jgi:apolipoprotein N-acyltransferase
MEFPTEKEVLLRLDELVQRHPETELVVLSEYVFDEPVPEKVREWCRKNGRYMIAGGKAPLGNTNFYDTAFVVAPSGELVFQQAKAVPIQFMKDGLPAPEQKVWNSPWGKIGMCVCYDLSYTRVTDRLVRQGAEALIVPTMDVADWGEWQHKLHARIAPVRAAEYGLPIFRLASSGISQFVDGTGKVVAKTDCFADGVILCGTLELKGPGKLPMDRWLGPFSAGMMVVLIGWALVRKRFGSYKNSGREQK